MIASKHFADKVWRIPAERMKMKRPHLVPLSKQALQILKEVHALTGERELMFPAIRARARPISENTLNAALRFANLRRRS